LRTRWRLRRHLSRHIISTFFFLFRVTKDDEGAITRNPKHISIEIPKDLADEFFILWGVMFYFYFLHLGI
jgi:hypothetical protein